MPNILPYDHARDFKAVRRIHYEVGWLSNSAEAKAFEKMVPHLDGVVYPIDGEAECAVFTCPGAMRYLAEDVEMCAVLAVTTSRVARKLGAAKQLTAHALAAAAEAGNEIATLGMFEQGFYDQLGFGTGAYARAMRFDPATLTVDTPFRRPTRLGRKDWRRMHEALQRLAFHLDLDPPWKRVTGSSRGPRPPGSRRRAPQWRSPTCAQRRCGSAPLSLRRAARRQWRWPAT